MMIIVCVFPLAGKSLGGRWCCGGGYEAFYVRRVRVLRKEDEDVLAGYDAS